MNKRAKKDKHEDRTSRGADEPCCCEGLGDSEQGSGSEAGESVSDDKVTKTSAEAVTVEEQLAQLQERYQRLGADYANYQKRSHRQVEQASQFTRDSFARTLLPVLDNLEHTLNKGSEEADGAALLQGVRIVYDHLVNVLAGYGLSRIEVAAGSEFDPSLHEAVLHEQTDQLPENKVLRELASGYVINDRTLRPAKVAVAKASAKDGQDDDQDSFAEGKTDPKTEESD